MKVLISMAGFEKNTQSIGSSHNVTWPGNIPDRFHDLVLRMSLFFFHLVSSLTNYHFIHMVQYRNHFLILFSGLL